MNRSLQHLEFLSHLEDLQFGLLDYLKSLKYFVRRAPIRLLLSYFALLFLKINHFTDSQHRNNYFRFLPFQFDLHLAIHLPDLHIAGSRCCKIHILLVTILFPKHLSHFRFLFQFHLFELNLFMVFTPILTFLLLLAFCTEEYLEAYKCFFEILLEFEFSTAHYS